MGICGNGESNPENSGGVNAPIAGSTSARVADKITKEKNLRVFGHCFNSDTRTVLTLLDLSGIEYDYEEINIFEGKH